MKNGIEKSVTMVITRHNENYSFFIMMRRPPGTTLSRSSAASDEYKREWLVTAATFAELRRTCEFS